LKRVAANYTGATLNPMIAPQVPHIAILAKAPRIDARRSAFDAKALALTVLSVQDVAIATKAPRVDARRFAFEATTVPHITILAKAAGVYARRFAFDAQLLTLAAADKRGGFEHALLVFGGRGGTSLMVVAHIASPTHTVNEIGAGYAAPWTRRDGRGGAFLMEVAHIASPTHPLNETCTLSATPWTFDF